jgi:hypothetical protein
MTFKETLSAFVCGVAAMIVLHALFVDLNAQAKDDALDVCVDNEGVMRVIGGAAACSPGERKLRLKQPPVEKPCEQPRDIAPMLNRIAALESPASELVSEKAVAPFEVVNEAGIVIFSVNEGNGDLPALTRIFNDTGARVATIAARTAGGELTMSSAAAPSAGASQSKVSGVEATLSTWGNYSDLTVTTNSETRLQLGRRPKGNYGLTTYGAGGKRAAALGAAEYGAGVALIFDTAGSTRISVQTEEAFGAGMVQVFDAAIKAVAVLAGNGAADTGLLQLTNNAGEAMVQAGVIKGIGSVQAGPGVFQQGKMFLPLPLGYIEGKK